METILSAIDVGSNAIRILIAAHDGQRLKVLKKIRAPVRLGHDVFETGVISKKTLKEVETTFERFAASHRKYKVQKYRAVGTSASREAKNSNDLIAAIKTQSGLQLEIINGDEEARLIHLAIAKELDLTGKKTMGIDVGGGSVEITFSESGKIHSSESFPVGTVRVLELLKKRKLNEDQVEIIFGEVLPAISRHVHSFSDSQKIDFAVGTGGNLECLGRLKVQLLHRTPNTFVTLSELGQIISQLRKMTYKQRIEKLDLRPDRADVIVPASLLVELIMRQAEIEKLVIPAVGLRDGLLWSLL